MTLDLRAAGFEGRVLLRDLWARRDAGTLEAASPRTAWPCCACARRGTEAAARPRRRSPGRSEGAK